MDSSIPAFEEFMASIAQFFDYPFSWVSDVIAAITANPVLLIFVVCVPLCGLGVGLFNRLIRSN